MLVVRKEGKAHDRFNNFRAAFELLETVGREPQDFYEEDKKDLLPLHALEQRMQQQIDELKAEIKQVKADTQQQMEYVVEINRLDKKDL